jgi:hypothetical protein
VLFGGGLQKFGFGANFYLNGCTGDRQDRRNLILEWNTKMTLSGRTHAFVTNRNSFLSLNPASYEHVFGKRCD